MLLTKLHIPTPSKETIHRQGLVEKLDDSRSKKLVLVSAPAGYGKTTLISDWITQRNISVAWCSIDKRDNDPIEFLKIVITSIHKQYNEIGQSSLELLKAPGTASIQYVIELFINDLLKLEGETVLVLDDLHLVSNKQVFDVLSALIKYKPQNLPLIISTRSDPPLSFSRLRSQNEMLELRATDLSFSKTDISFLFNKKLKLELTENDLNILEQKTEGWIAGLQLTAITVQGHKDISGYLKKMAGDNRYIMDYLMEEVLNNQSEELNQFLLSTSILERLSGSLCDAVLLKNNSQQILDSLEKNNMFLISLDDERKWFRYHHLFADLLQQRLVIECKEKIPGLHQNASQWFEKNKLTVLAIEHSLNAGNKQKAISLIGGIIDNLWGTSQYGTILKFGGMFSDAELVTNANFCIIYSWVLFESGNIVKAESLLLKLLDQTQNKNQLGKIYVCLNNLKAFTGDIESAFKYSELATQNISEDDILWNIWAHISHGESHLLRLELSESLQALQKAGTKASEANIVYLKLISQARASFVLWSMGKYSEAFNKSKNLLEAFNADTSDSGVSVGFASSILYSIVGNYQVEINDIEAGIQNVLLAYELTEKTTNEAFKASCAYMLAQAYYRLGDYNKAIKIIEDLDSFPYKKTMQLLGILSDSLKSKLYILMNKQDKLKLLFERKIKSDKNHAFGTCMYNIHKARYIIAQGNFVEAIDLLQDISTGIIHEKAYGLLAEVGLLKAKAYLLIQEQEKAIEYLSKVVRRTQNFGLIRMYINEGEEIETLLKELNKLKATRTNTTLDSVDNDYINKLLNTFDNEKRVQKAKQDTVLSSREIDALKLIAQDLTNQEIADKLFISLNTVKTRLKNIFLKLEVSNRRKAVEKAKNEGLL